jgi:hypothetical protein
MFMQTIEFEKKQPAVKSFKQELIEAGIPVKDAMVMGSTVIVTVEEKDKAALEAHMAAAYDKKTEKAVV